MSKEAKIKENLEEYLNLLSSIKDYSQAKDEAAGRYHHLLNSHPPKNNTYDVHSAGPIISAYDEMINCEREVYNLRHKQQELAVKIKSYIQALNGAALHVRFNFDDLDHRAGEHVFFIEDGELKNTQSPILSYGTL